MTEGKPQRAISLLSGGLDSSLAVKMLIDQGIAVGVIHFSSPFCNCTSTNAGCKNQAVKAVQESGVPIRVIQKEWITYRFCRSQPMGTVEEKTNASIAGSIFCANSCI